MPLNHVINFLNQVDELEEAKSLLSMFVKHSNSLEQFDQLGMLFEKVKAYPQTEWRNWEPTIDKAISAI